MRSLAETTHPTSRQEGNTGRLRYNFPMLESLRACQPEDTTLAGFDHSAGAWGRGSECVHLTQEPYGKLNRL
jgi:hypothetical protein